MKPYGIFTFRPSNSNEMKVRTFAHYQDIFRWRTLIQVGDDWTVRGTVIMKNPGSSKPTFEPISELDLPHLNLIDSEYKWFTFSVDQTMAAIISLFSQRAQTHGETFCGIIQIFNLINTMSPNLSEGIRLFLESDSPLKSTVATDTLSLVAPVYIGWGALHCNKDIAPIARSFLEAARAIANVDYQAEACFTHPLYLMRYGAKNPKCVNVRTKFCSL